MSALVGKKHAAPGESFGLMTLAGATIGEYYTLTARGARLGIVSSDGSVAYELDNNTPIVTNSEVTVRNLSANYDIVVVLAIPTPSGGGGGGTGETPTLDDILTASGTAGEVLLVDGSGTIVSLTGAGLNNMSPGNTLAQFGVGGIGIQSLVSGDGANISLNGLGMNKSGAVRMLNIADGATGNHTISLPNAAGQLALKSDIVVPAPPGAGTYTLRSVDGVVSWVSA